MHFLLKYDQKIKIDQNLQTEQIMEVEEVNYNCSLMMQMLVNTSSLPIINTILSYLDKQELEILSRIGLNRLDESRFFKVAVAKVFMAKYLNRVDRSVFFVFYEDQSFRIIQQNTSSMLAYNHQQFLKQSFKSYQLIMRYLEISTRYLNSQPDFKAIIEQLFFQPQLPMPKLKRQTIGMYCESAFQQYISLLSFPDDDIEQMWMQQPLEQLKARLDEQLTELLQKNIFHAGGKQQINKKIRDVRFCGYKINHTNWKSYLIQKFKTHNLIVLLLALCSQLVFTFQQFIVKICDPFMKFTQFALRANIYRNIVLSIEQKLSFLMKNYDQFYANSFQVRQELPRLNFWRAALSIWIQNMKYFHTENKVVYNYISAKLRESNMNEFLKMKTQKLPSFFSQLKREMQFQNFSQFRKNQVYLQCNGMVEIQGFFQNNLQVYETLAKDYVQYMVDINMNELNVHWCGHSQHIIRQYPIFRDYYQNAVHQSLQFYAHIRKVIEHSVPKEIQLNIFREVLKEDLLYIQTRLYKPVIVKEVVKTLNKWIRNELQEMPGFVVFDEQGFAKHKIVLDFQQKDGLLLYFANKNLIPQDCPQQLAFYYNIQLEPTEFMFFKEIDEQGQNMQQMQQYFSDQGDQIQDEH